MTPKAALAELRRRAEPGRAEGSAAYHKTAREHLGVPNPVLESLARDWRRSLDLDSRLKLADGLWRSDIHEARILAAKLLTQARIRPDDSGAWALIRSWVPDFDSWAIADHACMAGQRRLLADPSRIEEIAAWTASDYLWTRRAALVITLPYARMNHPKPDESAIRERVLGWCADYLDDKAWFIQKAVAWWLRDLSRHDAARVRAFLVAHGDRMKPFARRIAGKYL